MHHTLKEKEKALPTNHGTAVIKHILIFIILKYGGKKIYLKINEIEYFTPRPQLSLMGRRASFHPDLLDFHTGTPVSPQLT